MRANEYTISAMRAGSRSPAGVAVSIELSSRRASAGLSTEVFPERTTWRGPRTEAAGLTWTMWPITSQSKRCRMAARRRFTLGTDTSRPRSSIQAATCIG